MNKNKRLLVLLGCTLGFVGLLAAFWFLGVGPYLTKLKQIKELENEVKEKRLALLDMQGENVKLKKLQIESLPADADLAKREYDLVLMKLLRESGNTGFTVNPDPNASKDPKGIPLIDASKKASYAYRKVVFNIRIPKTDLASVTEFLRRYYSMPLHQQITRLELKKLSAELSADKRPIKERNDIDATIVTEAIIVDGAPSRKSALPVPLAQAATLGGSAWAMIEQQPKAALGITPQPISQILSTGNRDYYLLSAKDLFHGTLPEIKPYVPPPGPPETVVVTPPKPNHSFAIKYGTLFRNNDGYEQTTEVRIYDLINNEDYELVITQTGEKTKCTVKKYYYIGEKRKPPERSSTLEISNIYMSNKNNFTVLAIDGDDLILSEIPSGLTPATAPKEDKPKTGSSKRSTLPAPDPRAMVLGGFVVTAPKPEKYYRWEYGKTLADIVELTKAEADKAVQRAHSRVISELEVINAKPGK